LKAKASKRWANSMCLLKVAGADPQTPSKFGYAACGITKYPNLPRNLLGQQGWLRNLKLAVIDYDNLLYLISYGS
jgi:hypothetical protein